MEKVSENLVSSVDREYSIIMKSSLMNRLLTILEIIASHLLYVHHVELIVAVKMFLKRHFSVINAEMRSYGLLYTIYHCGIVTDYYKSIYQINLILHYLIRRVCLERFMNYQ